MVRNRINHELDVLDKFKPARGGIIVLLEEGVCSCCTVLSTPRLGSLNGTSGFRTMTKIENRNLLCVKTDKNDMPTIKNHNFILFKMFYLTNFLMYSHTTQ